MRHEPAEYVKLNVAGMRFSFFPGEGTSPPLQLSLLRATKDSPRVNSLGMEFVPVPGKARVYMCRTETRVRDFRKYTKTSGYVQKGGANVLKIKEEEAGGPYSSWELDEGASWEKLEARFPASSLMTNFVHGRARCVHAVPRSSSYSIRAIPEPHRGASIEHARSSPNSSCPNRSSSKLASGV